MKITRVQDRLAEIQYKEITQELMKLKPGEGIEITEFDYNRVTMWDKLTRYYDGRLINGKLVKITEIKDGFLLRLV